METAKQVAWIGSLVAVGLLVLPRHAQATTASDQIRVRVEGKIKRYSGTIVEETATEVKVRRRTTSKTFKITEIDTINYAGMTQEMRQAFLDLKAGGDKLPKALKGFDNTIPAADANKQKYLRQALEFGQAEATARMAAADPGAKDLVDKAVELLHDFRRNHGKSRHYYPMALWLGRMYIIKGDVKNAEKAFDILAEAPFQAFKLLADVQRARIHMGAGKFDEALTILDKVAAYKTEDPDELKNVHEGMVLRCQCLQNKGQAQQAIAYLEKVVAESDPEDYRLRATAHNTLGDCLRGLGQIKDALLNYLRVDILYFTVASEHPKALYSIALCWDELDEAVKAAAVRKRLRTRYPRSEWRKKLEEAK